MNVPRQTNVPRKKKCQIECCHPSLESGRFLAELHLELPERFRAIVLAALREPVGIIQ
jgi:hypothetical protein